MLFENASFSLGVGERFELVEKVIAEPANLLLLDEPTHHLDIESCRAMIHLLKTFAGTTLIVSHDEYLLREAATKLIVLQGGRVRLFLGRYDEFLEEVGWLTEETVRRESRAKKLSQAADDQANVFEGAVGYSCHVVDMAFGQHPVKT